MNKTAPLLVASMLAALPLSAQAADIPPTIRISGKNYSMVHREQDPTAGSSVAEYAPKGATPGSWSSLVTIHERPPSESPESYIRKITEAYAAQHPGMKFSSGSSQSTGEHWMDAIFVSAPGPESPSSNAVEWNFFRAVPHPTGPRVLQYSERRTYKKSPSEVFSTWDLSALRSKLLPRLLIQPVP